MRIIDMDIKFYPKSGHTVLEGENSKYISWLDSKGGTKDWKYDPFTGIKRPSNTKYPHVKDSALGCMTYEDYLHRQILQANAIIKENTDYVNNLLSELDKQ